MKELKSYLTQELIDLKEEFEELAEDRIFNDNNKDHILAHAYEMYGSSELKNMILKAGRIPAGYYVISYLLSRFKASLEAFAEETYGISRRDPEWVKKVLSKSSADTVDKERDLLTEKLSSLIMEQFKANGCTEPQYVSDDPNENKVYASYSHDAVIQRLWTKAQVKNKLLLAETMTFTTFMMFALGIGMSKDYVDLFLKKVLRRVGLNIRDPKEAVLRIAFEQTEPDKRLSFYRSAMREYDCCVPEAPVMEKNVSGSQELLDFTSEIMSMFRESSYESVLLSSGELSDQSRRFIRNYKYLASALSSERKAVQTARELASVLIVNINYMAGFNDIELNDNYLRKTITFDVQQDSAGLPAGTMLKAVPCYEDGTPVDEDGSFRAEITENIFPSAIKTAQPEVTVEVTLLRNDTLDYKVSKGSRYLWEGHVFTNDAAMQRNAEKGDTIVVKGELPAYTVIPAGAAFIMKDKKENEKQFVCQKETTALPEWETAVKYVSCTGTAENPGAVEKHSVFTLSGFNGDLFIENKSVFKRGKKGVISGNVFARCSAKDYQKYFHTGTVLECVRDDAVFSYTVTSAADVTVKDPEVLKQRAVVIISEYKTQTGTWEYMDNRETFTSTTENGREKECRFSDKSVIWRFEIPEEINGITVVNPRSAGTNNEEQNRDAEKTASVCMPASAAYVSSGSEFPVEFRTSDGIPLKAESEYTAKNRKGFAEGTVRVRLNRRDAAAAEKEGQTVLVKKNRSSAYTWNGYSFDNTCEVSLVPCKGECIEACGVLPVNTVIEEGEEFVFRTEKEQTPVVFTCAETVIVPCEYRTIVRFANGGNAVYESRTKWICSSSSAGIYSRKKTKLSDQECELSIICTPQEYAQNFLEGAELVLSAGENEYTCTVLHSADPAYTESTVKFRIFEQTENRPAACRHHAEISFQVNDSESVMKDLADMNCSFDAEENKVVLMVNGIRETGDQRTMNINRVYSYLYEDFGDLADDEEKETPFDQETMKKLAEIMKDRKISKSALYALTCNEKNVSQVSRSDLITMSFLNNAASLQNDRLVYESDVNYTDSTADTKDYFVDEVNEVLREAKYYDLYPGDPYESLLTWILACHEPLELYRRICRAVYREEGEKDERTADE